MAYQDFVDQVELLVPAAAGRARVLAIVPAYNEQEAIAGTIAGLRRQAPEMDVLVVNDGSLDRTAAVARATGEAIVVDLPCNLGIGGAVQTGFKYAERHGYDMAIQFDADGQHLSSEIDKLLAPLRAGAADVVLGSRFLGLKSFSSTPARRLGIYMFYLVNSLLIGQAITDNTSGFRAYNRRAIAFLADHYPTDYPEPEAVILLKKNGFTLAEVPVAMQARQGGASSIAGLWSAYYMVKVMLAIAVTSLRKPVRWRDPEA
ncbi:MAG: glycosyltransferase family 2 protein [Candidatus Sericytochromatia bacterium]